MATRRGRSAVTSPRPWTGAERQRAMRLRADGLTFRQIGERLGRHPGVVQKVVNVPGVRERLRPFPQFDPRAFQQARAALYAEVQAAKRAAATTPPYKGG